MAFRTLILLSIVAAWTTGSTSAFAQPFALDAREDVTFGSRPGTLRIGEDGVVFETTDPKHRRGWRLDDVRQFRVASSRSLVIETYRSRGWRGAGRSRTYEYATATDIPDALVAFLLARVTRPVVTAVMPQRRTTPAPLAVAVHHEGTDTAGTLALYDDGLAFEADRDGFARYWRFADLDAVLRQDQYRLYVAAFEGNREHVRPFLFTLKQDLPPGFYDILWRHLNSRSTGDPVPRP